MDNNEFSQKAQSFLDAVISSGIRPETMADLIVEVIQNEHRTNQQRFLTAVKLSIFRYAEASFDARNQSSVEWAREVAKLPNSDLRFPYI